MGPRKRARKNGCDGKIQHKTEGAAYAHLRSLFKMKGYRGSVYHCAFCGFYHVGRHHKVGR